jgi:hypothetical protein
VSWLAIQPAVDLAVVVALSVAVSETLSVFILLRLKGSGDRDDLRLGSQGLGAATTESSRVASSSGLRRIMILRYMVISCRFAMASPSALSFSTEVGRTERGRALQQS